MKCAKEYATTRAGAAIGLIMFYAAEHDWDAESGDLLVNLKKEIEKASWLKTAQADKAKVVDQKTQEEFLRSLAPELAAAKKDWPAVQRKVEKGKEYLHAIVEVTRYPAILLNDVNELVSDPDIDAAFKRMNSGFNQMDSALDGLNSAVAERNRGINEMNEGVAQMNRALDEINAALDRANAGMDQANAAVAGTNKTLEALKSEIASGALNSFKDLDLSGDLFDGDTTPAENKVVQHIVSGALDLLPGVGDVKGIAEAITGTNSVTGEKMSGSERLIGSVILLRWMKAGKAAIKAEELTEAMKVEKATGKIDGWMNREAYRKVPDSLKGYKTFNNKGVGYRWNDGKGNGVRIDKGETSNSQVYQQVDHVVINSGGKVIGRSGKPITGSIKENAREAHIPVTEWVKWKEWNKP